MTRKSIFMNVLLLSFMLSCNKIKELSTKFRMDYQSSVSIPSSLAVNLPIDLLTPPVSTDAESTFENNNTRKDLVREIYLETLDIVVGSPSGRDLSFLKSIHIYIKADKLPELLLAYSENVPDNVGSSLSLDTSGSDFQEYIKGDSFSLKVTTVTDKLISEDVELNVYSTFLVTAGLVK